MQGIQFQHVSNPRWRGRAEFWKCSRKRFETFWPMLLCFAGRFRGFITSERRRLLRIRSPVSTTMELNAFCTLTLSKLLRVTGFVLYFCLPVVHSMAVGMTLDTPVRRVLMFGGNGFIGSATAEKLLAAGHTVVTVNRGNWYWDSYFVVRPFVTHIKCDRLLPLDRCTQLVEHLRTNGSFDVVVDFSAYHPFSIKETLKVLNNRAKLYVFISTDSVYDVCDKIHPHPSRETDAVRPESWERREQLEATEGYGHRKLLIEEELAAQRESGGIPYAILRLPDVIGPRDNTYRWWIYQMWIRLSEFLDKPPNIPGFLENQPLSLVYVNDVAELIVSKLMDPKPEVIDQAFNLAFRETPTLLEILDEIKRILNMTGLLIATDNSTNAIHLFPSVKNGPINITKAEITLGWSPTPLKTAIQETVQFYEKAIRNPYFQTPRKEIIRTLQTHFTSRPFKVLLGLQKCYGLNFQMPKDEL